MTAELRTISQDTIMALVANGDLRKMTQAQKVEYYIYRCNQAGLDPSAKPFDILALNGKEILYANASCTQQLTSLRGLTVSIVARENVGGVYCVHARCIGGDGRSSENMGAVSTDNLKGEALANALMKATTKAIRRTVLAHCGLGMMDEVEVETIPGAERTELKIVTPETPAEAFQAQQETVTARKPQVSAEAAAFADAVGDGPSTISLDNFMELTALCQQHGVNLPALEAYCLANGHLVRETLSTMKPTSFATLTTHLKDAAKRTALVAKLTPATAA